MTHTTARLGGLAAALLAATLLAGCADDSSGAAGQDSTTSRSSAADSAANATFADADVTFAAGMIPHHGQAIEMAQLAEGRAADPRVLDLAARIEAAQGPEIETLAGWLDQWGVEDDMAGMDHDEMSGMMSDQDMQALMGATGMEFDRPFLQMMIEHHRGALQMAEAEAAAGQNPDAIAMAETIRDTQAAEIAEMQQLLTELGG